MLEQTHGIRNKPNFVLIGLVCRPPSCSKNRKFCHFWTLLCGVASWQRYEKVEHRYI